MSQFLKMGVKIVYKKQRRPAFLLLMALFVICAAGAAAAADDSQQGGSSLAPTTGSDVQEQSVQSDCNLDIDLEKKDSPDPVTAGNNLTYNVTVYLDDKNRLTTETDSLEANNKPKPPKPTVVLHDVTIYDHQATVNLKNPQWSCNGVSMGTWTGSYHWDWLELKNGKLLIQIWGQVPSSQPEGWIYNEATVRYAFAFIKERHDPRFFSQDIFGKLPPRYTYISDSCLTRVNTLSDVWVTKSDAGSDPVTAGGNIVYTIVAGNSGPSDAQGVVVKDTLHTWISGATYKIVGGALNGQTGSWTGSLALGAIAAGEQIKIIITGLVNASAPMGSVIENTANVATTTKESDTLNNIAFAATGVVSKVNLSVTKAASTPVTAGGNIIYTIVVSNSGPSDATNVVVTDVLPSWITSALYKVTGGTLDGTSGTWVGSLNIGTLAPGASVTIVLNGTVNASTPDATVLVNNVTVTSEGSEGNATDNSASVSTTVSNPSSGGGGVTPPISGGGSTTEPTTTTETTEEPLSGGEAVSAAGTTGMQTTGAPIALLVMALLMLLSGLGIRKQ